MATRALLTAVRNVVWESLGYTRETCGLGPPGGQPPSRMGKWWVSVWRGARRPIAPSGYAVNADYGVNLTLTMRINEGFDSLGDYLAQPSGFYDRVEDLCILVHRDSYDFVIGRAANKILEDPLMKYTPDTTGAEVVGFRSGLRWLGDSQPRLVNAAWFHSNQTDLTGVVCDITCGGAVRIQNPQNITVADFGEG